MKKIPVLLLLLAITCIPACKKDSDPAPPKTAKPAVTPAGTVSGTPVTQTVGAAGGTVISDDGEMELIIPAGALTSNTAITIQPVTNNAPNGRRKAYRCLPDGLQFAQNITIRFHYTEEDAAATKPEYMMIAFQTDDGHWQVLEDVTNDPANNIVSVPVNHFTDFSAFDVMRIEPPALYLKTGEKGEYKISAAGMSVLNGVLLLNELLDQPETWKVNGVTGGNSTNGTIAMSADGTKGVYTAPANAPPINPVTITAEINFPFVVDGQQFNKGILTAEAHIFGGRYAVIIEATLDLTLGTGEKFRMHDHCRFTVNLTGSTGVISDIQNSAPTFQKIQNSTNGCNTTVAVQGTGFLHLRPQDVLGIMVVPVDKQVIIGFGIGETVYSQFLTSCPGVTPGQYEIPIGNFMSGSSVMFYDSGQPQFKEVNSSPYYISYTFTPLG